MTGFASLLEITAYTALIVGPAIALNRLLAGAEGPTLADLFAIPVDPPWPHGVQEEEPRRWRLDPLERRPVAADPIAADCRQRGMPNAAPARGSGIG